MPFLSNTDLDKQKIYYSLSYFFLFFLIVLLFSYPYLLKSAIEHYCKINSFLDLFQIESVTDKKEMFKIVTVINCRQIGRTYCNVLSVH